ncbi:MAG: TatD family hydrolase [Fermentimonas sp.]|jgi:TatD DNase family protein
MIFYDIHTHKSYDEDQDSPDHLCIYDVYPLEFEVRKELNAKQYFSCGIHPWYSENSTNQFPYLREILPDERIIAIGEAGFDKLKGPSLEIQEPVFREHIILSEQLNKPLIIHAVKAWDRLIKIKQEFKPENPWIIHGYRGSKVELTKWLVNEGFYFSLGENINIDTTQVIPLDRLFCETDESEVSIEDIYMQVAHALNISLVEFASIVSKNVEKVFPMLYREFDYDSLLEE